MGENESPSDSETIDALQLTEHEIAQRLRNCPLPGIAEYEYEDDDFRISLAGVQSSEAKEVIGLLLQSVPSACESVSKILPDDFSQKVADKVLEGVLKSSQELSEQID